MKNKSLDRSRGTFKVNKYSHLQDYKRVDLNLGWMCNNNCIFCSETKARMMYIGTKYYINDFDSIIKSLKEFKKRGYMQITFMGGEPTIRNDFIEIIKMAKKMGYTKISVTTNARRLSNNNYAKELINAGIDEIGISVHGHNKEVHDALTRSPGSFEQATKAIKNISKLTDNFFTSTVINKINYRHLPEIYSFLSKFKPKNIFFSFMYPFHLSDKRYKLIVPAYSETMPYIYKMLSLAEKNKIWTTVANVPLCLLPGKYMKYKDELVWPWPNQTEKRIIRKRPLSDNKDTKYKYMRKYPKCKSCFYYEQCEGVRKNYKRTSRDKFPPLIKLNWSDMV